MNRDVRSTGSPSASPIDVPVDQASNGKVQSRTQPRTVFSAPLYNHAAYLEAALDSLLSQTERDFALLLVDDVSKDATPEIARRYAERDSRVEYRRNERRLGLARNWRWCFELARELYPQAEFFAWASDHDVWHPRWLETMISALDLNPEVVLAYPTSERITAEGKLSHCRGGFQTVGVPSPVSRIRLGCHGLHAGDMVYGLMRADCLERAGIFRRVLEPDRLLLAELAVQGQFQHVPQRLWQRRFVKSAVRARQRRAIFPHRRPLYSWLTPWIVRPSAFFWVYCLRGAGRPEVGRLEGLRLAASYAYATVAHVLIRKRATTRKRLLKAHKRIKRVRKRIMRRLGPKVGRGVRRTRRRLRHARHLPYRVLQRYRSVLGSPPDGAIPLEKVRGPRPASVDERRNAELASAAGEKAER
jgi:glycosyltransferase involved in cell wall biosynthesis